MQEYVQVNVRLIKTINDRLERECAFCGCTKNSVIQSAILDKIAKMVHTRKLTEQAKPLPGQSEMEIK